MAVTLVHALLRGAVPSVGGTVPAAPPAVVITFSEGVEPAFSTIVVTDAAGTRVDKGDVHLDGGERTRLAVGLPALPPGTYAVTWHALSVDTHRTEGRFTFEVAGGSK
jgi:methionine-rich copper-binding protein CopC